MDRNVPITPTHREAFGRSRLLPPAFFLADSWHGVIIDDECYAPAAHEIDLVLEHADHLPDTRCHGRREAASVMGHGPGSVVVLGDEVAGRNVIQC